MKNLKKLLAVMLIAIFALGLVACGNDANGDSEKNTGAESSQPTSEKESEKESADDGKVLYTVKVVDEAGNPVEKVMVQWCLESCFPAMTNAEGIATYSAVEGDYKVSLTSNPDVVYHYENGATELTIVVTDEK